MKLNKREVILFSLIIGIVLFAIFWFLFLTPIRNQLDASRTEYDGLVKTDTANQAIIDSVSSLQDTQKNLESNITGIEQSLLPYLQTEVITEHLVNIMERNGMKFVTEISTEYPEDSQDRILNADGTYSPNSSSCLRVHIRASGTDGTTNGGIPFVGYDQFIRAVKDMEDENPKAIRIKSISMEDTGEGFQYFDVQVNVYAFNIPHPVSTPDLTNPYVIWNRPDAALGGLVGIPYALCLPNTLETSTTYKPFATYTTGSGLPVDTAAQAPTNITQTSGTNGTAPAA